MDELKGLYESKFGDIDVDEKNEYTDGTSMTVLCKDQVNWIVHRGAPPATSTLEQALDQLKALYSEKFGDEVDSNEKYPLSPLRRPPFPSRYPATWQYF